MWIDPREFPEPPLRTPARTPADKPEEIEELIRLCSEGRVFSVEAWIKAGRPLQTSQARRDARNCRKDSPLQVAIKTCQYDLALVLLCNGYQPDLELDTPLELAMSLRAWSFFELLVAWGADLKRVEPSEVLDTYRVDLMERFWDGGIDYTKDHVLARYLAANSSNRPLYGWAKRHHEEPRVSRDLAMALGEAVIKNRERAVHLLRWAGADPHLAVPSLEGYGSSYEETPEDWGTAVALAVLYKRTNLFKVIKPDPALDDFELLWSYVSDSDTADLLARSRLPVSWAPVIVSLLSRATWEYGDRYSAQGCLARIGDAYGARLTELDPKGYANLRHTVLKNSSADRVKWIFRWLNDPKHCDPEVFQELTRTGAMKSRLGNAGFTGKRGRGARLA